MNPTLDLQKFQVKFTAMRKPELDAAREYVNGFAHAIATLVILANLRRKRRLVGIKFRVEPIKTKKEHQNANQNRS